LFISIFLCKIHNGVKIMIVFSITGGNMFSLKGKNAVITGAAAGIGKGIAISLAKQGANIAITDRPGVDMEAVRQEVAAYGVDAIAVPMDVSDEEMINKAMEQILAHFGHVDIISSNAGINTCEDALSISSESWDKHFDINVKGGFLAVQKVIPGMIERGWGRIIFTASQAALVGRPNQPAYCATKGAICSLTRGLALDYASKGITVNAVAPTFVLTDISRKRMEDEEYKKWVLGMIPVGRLATVEDVGTSVAFLASEEAGMTTGHVLTIDGGWTIA
jgi:NAD(P)-dependent dehydrogenase (short-subunit alcohol dehydrogenase family)